jgi:hypothetical protein
MLQQTSKQLKHGKHINRRNAMTTATQASAREQLKESAKTIKSLTAAIERNREALDEARAQATQAEAILKGFDSLSTQISKWRA